MQSLIPVFLACVLGDDVDDVDQGNSSTNHEYYMFLAFISQSRDAEPAASGN